MTEPLERSLAAGVALLVALQKKGLVVSTRPFDRRNADQYRKSTTQKIGELW
jgi:hypothetical protein